MAVGVLENSWACGSPAGDQHDNVIKSVVRSTEVVDMHVTHTSASMVQYGRNAKRWSAPKRCHGWRWNLAQGEMVDCSLCETLFSAVPCAKNTFLSQLKSFCGSLKALDRVKSRLNWTMGDIDVCRVLPTKHIPLRLWELGEIEPRLEGTHCVPCLSICCYGLLPRAAILLRNDSAPATESDRNSCAHVYT